MDSDGVTYVHLNAAWVKEIEKRTQKLPEEVEGVVELEDLVEELVGV